LLDAGDPVLDLGCGCGVPATAVLAERFAVTGVDISPVQIERARRLVPAAGFLCQDMSEVDFPPEGFRAIVSFFAIIQAKRARFEVLWTRFIPEGDSGHTLLLAKRKRPTPTLPRKGGG